MEIKRFHNIVCILAGIIFIITAYNSIGFYHADEHFQIIEFAGIKLRTVDADELAWEYAAKSRQAIQPVMAIAVFKSLNLFGVENHYILAFVLRLLSAAYALFCIRFFSNATIHLLNKKSQKLYLVLSYLLWFVPGIAVRFSSETWGGLTFLLGVAMILSTKKKNWLAIGMILGFSFLFRYQMVFGFLGLGFWLLFIFRIKIKEVALLVLGTAIIVIVGIGIDSWFYDSFVITAWEYFSKQLLEGVVDSFGVMPWDFYFVQIVHTMTKPLGFAFYIACLVLLIFKKKEVVVWIIIPFILGHSFIGHKEIRFLFPMVFLLPMLLSLAYQQLLRLLVYVRFKYIVLGVLATFGLSIFIVNTIGLSVMMIKGAGNANIVNAKFLTENFATQPVQVYHLPWSSPFHPWENIATRFYTPSNIRDEKIETLCDLQQEELNWSYRNFLILREIDLRNKACDFIFTQFDLKKVSQNMPTWISKIDEFYSELYIERIYYVYEITKK